MNEENTKKLINDFPKLYRGVNMPLTQSLMSFGFMCDDGWFDLIYQLSKELTEELKKDKSLEEDVYVVEVKEKFGGLRFYITCGTDRIFDIITKYEEKSYKTCEICGKKGKLSVIGGWYRTLCKKHREEYGGEVVE